MVTNHSRAAATSGEVASRQTPTQQPSATVAHRQQVSKSQTSQMQDRPRRSPAEVRAVASTKILRIQSAIASLGADDIEERSSFGSRVVSCPTSSCDPSSRQAPKTGEETQCSRLCKDRAGREAEAGLRGGVGTGGEGSGLFPTRGRDGTSWWVRTMLAGVAGPGRSVGCRIVTSPRGVGTVEGWCGSRCTVWAKRETAVPRRRGASSTSSHADSGSSIVEHVVGGTPCRPSRRPSQGRQQPSPRVDRQVVRWCRADGLDDRRDAPMSAQAKQCWRGAVSVGSGLGRHRTQIAKTTESV